MLHYYQPLQYRLDTPEITHIGKGGSVTRGMPVIVGVVGKPEIPEANPVGPSTLLLFADLGGMIVPVPGKNEERVLLAEITGEPEGIVMFVEGAGEADG